MARITPAANASAEPAALPRVPSVESRLADSARQAGCGAAQNPVADKSSEELAEEFLRKSGMSRGLNEKNGKRIFVAVGTAIVDVSSPQKAAQLRSLKAAEAGMRARIEMARTLEQEMTADFALSSGMHTGLSTEIDRELDALSCKLAKATQELENALIDADREKAKEVAGVDPWAFARDSVSSVLSRIGATVDVNKLKAEQAQRLERAQARVESLRSQTAALEAKINDAKDKLGATRQSAIASVTRLTLSGLTPVAQFESFNGKSYEITIVATWTEDSQRLMAAIAAGTPMRAPQPGVKSPADDINGTNWAGAIGARRFIDNEGNVHMIGIGASPLLNTSARARRNARETARLNAMAELAYNLKVDVAAKTQADAKARELQDGTDAQLAQRLSEQLARSVRNQVVRGASVVYSSDRVMHPLTGRQLAVSVIALSPKAAGAALRMQSDVNTGVQAVDAAAAATPNTPDAGTTGAVQGTGTEGDVFGF